MLSSVWLAVALTFVLSVIWLRLNDFAAARGWVDSAFSRKIIHIGTGPVFVLCWLLFPEASSARFLAALVPGLITAQFVLVGTGVIEDEAAVQAMSRSGDRREILRGPLFYGLVFVAVTLLFWRETPVGIIALMLMCGGDGMADLVGRRWGRRPLPWSPSKTWLGSLGMFTGGLILAGAVIGLYQGAGYFSEAEAGFGPAIFIIAALGTGVESLPLRDVDNLTVTAVAILAGSILI